MRTLGQNVGGERSSNRIKRPRVGTDLDTKSGPIGVKDGSLVGKYESLVQITVILKGKEHSVIKEDNGSRKGMTDKLQEVMKKVKTI